MRLPGKLGRRVPIAALTSAQSTSAPPATKKGVFERSMAAMSSAVVADMRAAPDSVARSARRARAASDTARRGRPLRRSSAGRRRDAGTRLEGGVRLLAEREERRRGGALAPGGG